MRLIGYKLDAKSCINENMGRCLFASVLFLFPKFAFMSICFVNWLAYKAGLAHGAYLFFAAVLGLIVMFVLDAVLVPFGELVLFDLFSVDEACEDLESTREYPYPFFNDDYEKEKITGAHRGDAYFFEIINVLKSFGLARLMKLRICLLTNLAKDVAMTVVPALLLVAGLLVYAFSRPLPIAAFITFIISWILILLLALMEIGVEYDKYRFVYTYIPSFLKEFSNCSLPYKSMLLKSMDDASNNIREIRRCEVSFWGWEVMALISLPILLPMLYLLPYKKLTLYTVII